VLNIPRTRREREIWEVCDNIWKEIKIKGIPVYKITGKLIKEKLLLLGYNKGNQSQIYQYRNTWMLNHNIVFNDFKISIGKRKFIMTDNIHKAVENLFGQMQSEANNNALKLQKELEETLINFKDKQNDLYAEIDCWKNKFYNLFNELVSIKKLYKDLCIKLSLNESVIHKENNKNC